MTDFHYTLFYGTTKNARDKIVLPEEAKIDNIHLLDSIQNIRYKYVDLMKSTTPVRTYNYNSSSAKIIYMHYKPGCPFTEKAIRTIMQYPGELIVRLWNINTNSNGNKVKEYLRNYKKHYNLKDFNTETFPQFFHKGDPLGGADTLALRLTQI
jgi:glutaredoxin-related protein